LNQAFLQSWSCSRISSEFHPPVLFPLAAYLSINVACCYSILSA
jgi:hypothetical protein